MRLSNAKLQKQSSAQESTWGHGDDDGDHGDDGDGGDGDDDGYHGDDGDEQLKKMKKWLPWLPFCRSRNGPKRGLLRVTPLLPSVAQKELQLAPLPERGPQGGWLS